MNNSEETGNKIYFRHFGCRLNLFESTALETEFLANGFEKSNAQDANWIIVNTCAVTQRAEEKNRQAIRRLSRENQNAKIVVTGCYATRKDKKLKELSGIYSIIENDKKGNLLSLLQNSHSLNFVSKEENRFKFSYHQKPTQSRAYLKIQDGCNRRCSYCQIPFSRGKGASRSLQEIQTELKKILSYGFQEIVITGVNIGDYSYFDSSKQITYDFFDLLQELSTLESPKNGNNWYFRLSSLEPDTISSKILPLYQNKKLAAFLHTPLQSGSDKILKYMKRDYDVSLFHEKIDLVHSAFPYVQISSDVITGFPAETEEDFLQTQKIIQENFISSLHVFPYSHREGTSIDKIIEEYSLQIIPSSVASQRVRQLNELSHKLSKEYLKKNQGKTFRAIFEKSKKGRFFTENGFHIERSMLLDEYSFPFEHGEAVLLEKINDSLWKLIE